MLRHQYGRLALAALLLSTPTPDIAAQIRGSERGTVSQVLDGTTVTVGYARVAARGRELFGALVPYDSPWTGANWATTIEADKDIRLNGAEVPAGTYSVWIVPRGGAWRVSLDPKPDLYHFQKPDSTAEQIHLAAEPGTAPHSELLTWTFPAVSGDVALLRMHWGTTTLPLQIEVPPTRSVTLPEEQRTAYMGTYQMTIPPGIGWPASAEFVVTSDAGMLRGQLPFGIHPGDDFEFDLLPAGVDRFNAQLYRNGKIFNVEAGVIFEFHTDGKTATGVTFRGVEGSSFGEGARAGTP
jgi:hypothetical protein